MNYTFTDIELGKLSRAYRAYHGMSQADFAEKCGLSFTSIRRYEDGDYPTKIAYMRKWLEGMEVSFVAYVMRGDDE